MPPVGLVIAGVVLVGLVVAVVSNGAWALEFCHVAFGVAWTIIDLFVGFVIGPILDRLSLLEPANIAVLIELKKRRPNPEVIRQLMPRKLPPVTEMAMVSRALIVAGGIYLSAHLPQHVRLAPAAILLAPSAAVMVVNAFSLWRVRGFAWGRFFAVAPGRCWPT